jgi:acetyl-CoA carboxylase biotin carboxyl carrier protein
MDLNYLRRLVKVFDDSKATHLEIEEDGVRISLGVENATIQQSYHTPVSIPVQSINQSSAVLETPVVIAQAPIEAVKKVDSSLHTIKSPIVGTFYRSPSPDAGSFVEVGSRVKQGETLCIIEAMKLMNEIESDVAGIIEEILIDNAKPVEFNQPIFVVRPD